MVTPDSWSGDWPDQESGVTVGVGTMGNIVALLTRVKLPIVL